MQGKQAGVGLKEKKGRNAIGKLWGIGLLPAGPHGAQWPDRFLWVCPLERHTGVSPLSFAVLVYIGAIQAQGAVARG